MPIDEMILELRFALEAFEDAPGDETFERIQREILRIEGFCENFWWGWVEE